MATMRHKPEEIVTKLRQVEVLVGQGMARVDAVREVRIAELPRLIAVSQFKTEDSNIDSSVRLIVVGPDLMYGSIEATGSVVGDTIYAFRAITLSR